MKLIELQCALQQLIDEGQADKGSRLFINVYCVLEVETSGACIDINYEGNIIKGEDRL